MASRLILAISILGCCSITISCSLIDGSDGGDGNVRVSGSVVSAESGRALQGVGVRLYSPGIPTAWVPRPMRIHAAQVTDENGEFSVSATLDCPSDGVFLFARHEDYLSTERQEVRCPGTSTVRLEVGARTISQRINPSSATLETGQQLTLEAVFTSIEGTLTSTPTFIYRCTPYPLNPFPYCISNNFDFGVLFRDGWGYFWEAQGYPCGYLEGSNTFVAPVTVPGQECGGSPGEVRIALAPRDSVVSESAVITVR